MAETPSRLRDFLRAPKFGDPTKDRIAGLQHTILLGLLVAAVLAIVVSLAFLSQSWEGYGLPLGAIILSVIAISWQRQGHIERATRVLVGSMLLIFLFTFSRAGFTFTSALILALGISLAGLLQRTSRFIAASFLYIAALWLVPRFVPMALVAKPNEMVFASVIIGLESILLIAASRTLKRSFEDVERGTQNLMSANRDLQNLTSSLEQRVAERTQALSDQATKLQAAAEVSRTISSLLDADELTYKAVNLMRERFDLYHAGLFLIDEDERTATLYVGAGPTKTPIVKINDQTAVGWAIAHREAWTVAHVEGQIRSEVALPLIAQGEVIGALTLHSQHESAFSAEDVTILQTMTDQLANGIEKARLYNQTQQRASELDRARAAADAAREEAENARLVAESANYSLAAQMWQTAGQAILNEKMRGEQDTTALSTNIIRHLCKYLNAETGAIYILDENVLRLSGTYAYRNNAFEPQYQLGEDLVGQAALSKEVIEHEIPEEYLAASLEQDILLPKSWLFAPLIYDQQVSGVVALQSMTAFTAEQKQFIQQIMESIAIALMTAQARTRANELLARSRQQAEELQAQEEELRTANEELQAQTDNLRHARA